MRAARCEKYGTPDVVSVQTVPEPVAGPGHVLVDVAAAAVNYPDVLFIADKYQVSMPLPYIPGGEFAGTVRAIGSGVSGLRVGDRVMGSAKSGGAFAERIAVPADVLTPVPAGLAMVEAAAFPVVYTTAYHALVTVGRVQRGDWVVVLGAAGGVGTATVDIATRLGARVIACASSSQRLQVAKSMGAAEGIAYGSEDLKDRIKQITGGGATLVIDPVGGGYSEQALRALAPGGVFVTVGFAAGEIPRIPLNLVLLKDITIRGLELRTLPARHPEAVAAAGVALAELVGKGMKPHVSRVYPLERVVEALERVAGQESTGKVVVAIDPAV
ncbi:NADPH:quinone oxidoreductase family protein [Nocardia sp. NPDC052278]|uniref:NADPH:quinone oxidoreductase family protein n=1 Tax=unclassified Nocardia TaxID=2637762 RepID=UPI0036B3EA7D